MAWNEPGKKGRDPWGDRGNAKDLDEVVRRIQQRLQGFFGGGNGDSNKLFGSLFVGIAVVAWVMFTGVYTVDAAERGVELRFGKYLQTTTPGLHIHLPWPMVTHQVVNVDSIKSFSHRTQMFTKDENLVEIDMVVQYVINDVEDYLFKIRDPELTVRDVSESAIREVVGTSTLEAVLGADRPKIPQQAMQIIQETLDGYQAGVLISSVNLQQVQFPSDVKGATDDVVKAREDKERFENEAKAYANDLVPKARGQAARRIQEAEAYREQVVAEAEGDAQRFLKVLAQYQAAPSVTRERLYLETMEQVLGRNAKVILDTEGNGNLIYLPVDRLLEQSGARRFTDDSGGHRFSTSSGKSSDNTNSRDDDDYRSRRNRQ